MKYPFFASFLVLCAIFYHNRKKADRSHAKIMQDYFKRENEANNTRKQPLDDLEYINIDLDRLPTQVFCDDDLIVECINDITILQNNTPATGTIHIAGFKGLDSEWWHFTLKNEPYPDTYFDFDVE